jgi:gamma-glutamyltranspeptidase/glutathione hydrolase
MRSRHVARVGLIILLSGICGCTTEAPIKPAPIVVSQTITAKHGIVVSVCPIASRIGCEVLQQGGNAADAAIATAFALAVTWPEAGNIGGGGFMMVYRPATETDAPIAQFIDYRETAPAAVTKDSFSNKPSSYLLAGTPGTVRGLRLAYEHCGSAKLPWKSLVMPAAKLAREGFTVNAALAASLNSGLKNTKEFPEFRRVYGKGDGSAWQAGDRITLPQLGRTLQEIAERGPEVFYQGRVAHLIAEEMRLGHGLMKLDDLRNYEARLRQPLTGTFKDLTIYAPPPPSSGGVALLEMLNILENFELKSAERWSAPMVHLIVESMRRAYADRARYLGDPDFSEPPIQKLLEKSYGTELAGTIDPQKASSSESVAPWTKVAETGGQTTHFSVIDEDGMAVSNTYTLEQSFGGKIVVRGAGFLLNNELGDFNPKPGVTTSKGLIGTPPNEAAPRKRPLSSMTPIIATRDGKAVLVIGSPGGRTIINTVTQVFLNRVGFGMTLRQAVDAPRLHHQWFPDAIRAEQSLAQQFPQLLNDLQTMGHKIDPNLVGRQGDAHSIEIDTATGKRTGVADKRIGGAAAGY